MPIQKIWVNSNDPRKATLEAEIEFGKSKKTLSFRRGGIGWGKGKRLKPKSWSKINELFKALEGKVPDKAREIILVLGKQHFEISFEHPKPRKTWRQKIGHFRLTDKEIAWYSNSGKKKRPLTWTIFDRELKNLS